MKEYLKDKYFANKSRLPDEMHSYLETYMISNSGKIFYDYEAQNNIYTLTLYLENENQIIVLYKTTDDVTLDENEIIKQIHAVNDLTLNIYFNHPDIFVRKMEPNDIRAIFEQPTDYVIGFNSNHYDSYITAFLLSIIYQTKTLPEPNEVRRISNWIIKPGEIARTKLEKVAIKNGRGSFGQMLRQPGFAESHGYSLVNYCYYGLLNTGLALDMRTLNEKDTAGLKTIAAQLGYQVEEPTGVDLSSDDDLTEEQMVTLLAYNVSDVLVTKLIFEDKAYKEKLKTRIQLLDRFDESSFHGRLSVNSTSAQFVEKVIAPFDKLKDSDEISYFYPVGGKYQTVLDEAYSKTLTEQEMNKLDNQYTEEIQHMEEYGPVVYKDKTIPRFRVKYGQLQEDLLELMRLKFPNFPEEVYDYYDMFRGAKNDGNVPARKAVVDKFVANHPAESLPKHWHYKRKNASSPVTGISVSLQVPNSPMVLTFSVGGVHGEVIDVDAYQRDDKKTDEFNALLDKYKDQDPAELYKSGNKEARSVISAASKKFKRRKKKVNPKDYVIPVDLTDAVHVDVDSLYPSLMINLHLFSTWVPEFSKSTFGENGRQGHFMDIYAKLREERVAKKKFAEAGGPNKSLWSKEQKEAWDTQLINKLLLNSASGIADGAWDTNVRMNNKASSMRIMGQLILTYLIFSVQRKGYYSVSTNTDGVYLTKDGINDINDIVDEIEEWKAHFHLGATPEIIKHLVSKDANNRFEQQDLKDAGSPAGGTIGNAYGADPAHKETQPFCIDHTIVTYFKESFGVRNITEVTPPREVIRNILQRQLDLINNATKMTKEVKQAMLSFCWVLKPRKNTYLYIKDKDGKLTILDQVNRVVLVKSDNSVYIGAFTITNNADKMDPDLTNLLNHSYLSVNDYYAKKTKLTNFSPEWNEALVNKDISYYFGSEIWKHIDLDAYTDFAISRIIGDGKKKTIWTKPKF